MFAARRSGSGDAQFWVDTCFTEIDGTGVADESWDQSTAGIVAASGLVHEYTHWQQQHGTRFGVFVFAISHRRQEIVECFLRKLRIDRRAEALERWRAGQPLWPFTTSEEYGAFVDAEDRTLRRLVDHWRALFALEKMMLEPKSSWIGHFAPIELFRLADLHLGGRASIAEIAIGDDPRFEVDKQGTDTGSMSLTVSAPLSCLALQEAAAFLNQREFYANSDTLEAPNATDREREVAALHATIWNDHLDDPSGLYVDCIKYFDGESGFDINEESALAALLAILDIALQAPVPPFAVFDDLFPASAPAKFKFEHLRLCHPVYRFTALVDALRATGLPRDAHAFLFDRRTYEKFCARLRRKAGLQSRALRVRADPIVEGNDGVWMTLPDSPLALVKNLVFAHHVSAARLRQTFPSSFAAPVANLLYSPNLRRHLTTERTESVFIAPLQIIDGVGWLSGIATDNYFDVLYSAAHGRALTSLLSNSGEYFQGGLPRDASHFAVVERAQRELERRLDARCASATSP